MGGALTALGLLCRAIGISVSTTRRIAHLHNLHKRVRRRKPFLSLNNKLVRVLWARDVQDLDWKRVISRLSAQLSSMDGLFVLDHQGSWRGVSPWPHRYTLQVRPQDNHDQGCDCL